jgi:hypothetical protein
MKTRVIQPDPTRPEAPAPAPPPAVSHRPRGRMLLVFGALLVLVALPLLAGGLGVKGALGSRDGAGYFMTGAQEVRTGTHALVTDDLDVDADVPQWLRGDRFATARIDATSSRPVFIGIGPTAAVERYLAGAGHTLVTDVDTDPFRLSTQAVGGDRRPQPPAQQRFWRAQATGSGTQSLRWPVETGDWSTVVMNADGTRGVAAQVRVGAKVSALSWVATGLLIAGGLVLAAGGGLLYLGARRRRVS